MNTRFSWFSRCHCIFKRWKRKDFLIDVCFFPNWGRSSRLIHEPLKLTHCICIKIDAILFLVIEAGWFFFKVFSHTTAVLELFLHVVASILYLAAPSEVVMLLKSVRISSTGPIEVAMVPLRNNHYGYRGEDCKALCHASLVLWRGRFYISITAWWTVPTWTWPHKLSGRTAGPAVCTQPCTVLFSSLSL